MNQEFTRAQEIIWKKLRDAPFDWTHSCEIPPNTEPLVKKWSKRDICDETLISWDPAMNPVWKQTAISRRIWFDYLLRDIEQRWQPQGNSLELLRQTPIGGFDESWSQWWRFVRTNCDETQQQWAAWILQTFVRAHPNLYVWVGIKPTGKHPLGTWKSKSIFDHVKHGEIRCDLLIEETVPIDMSLPEDVNYVKNVIQELSGMINAVPDSCVEGTTGITWRLLVVPDEFFETTEECDENPFQQDILEKWRIAGWNLSGSGTGWDIARRRMESHAWIDAMVHSNSVGRNSMIPHREVPLTAWWLSYIWRRWQCYTIPVRDRLRFVVAGGMVKSCYALRDAKDLDFLVCDHNGSLEGKYHPELGGSNLRHFHDFGRTYYPCEKYFFPIRPEWYKAQKNYQKNKKTVEPQNSDEILQESEMFGAEWIPKFSASGLKASRYFPILQWLWDRFRRGTDISLPALTSLDDLMLNPGMGFFRWGIRFAPIEWEFQRDHLKDIDLGWVSKKQVGDIETFLNLYGENPALGFRREKTHQGLEWVPSLTWKWNIYHGELINDPITSEPVGLEVKIRRAPDSVHRLITSWIRESHFPVMKTDWSAENPWRVEISSNGVIVHHWDDHWNQEVGMEQLIARQVLVSSLPPTIEYKGQQVPAVWWWVMTVQGEIHVQLWVHNWNLGCAIPHLTRGEPWIAAGTCQMTYPDAKKAKLLFSLLRTEESIPVWGIEGRETETQCFNLSRFLNSLKYKFLEHKTFDAQQARTFMVDYSPDLIIPDWESTPWTKPMREYWEQSKWIGRWIPAPNPQLWERNKGAYYQNKLGFVQSNEPTNQWKELLTPKPKTQRLRKQ